MSEEPPHDEAFVKLFEEHFNTLLKIAWGICSRREVAEEICQEAFLRYYMRQEHLPQGKEALFWMIRVVKNLTLNYEKRQKRENLANQSSVNQQQIRHGNEGEQSILMKETQERVKKSLNSIPYKLRIALILREYAGYSYASIARILHISENNVKIRIFRARQYLSKLLSIEDFYVP